MKFSAAFVTLALALAASARPSFNRRADFTLKNGQDAIALNEKFKTLTADSACNAGDNACVNGQFAQCVGGKFVLQPCAGGTTCAALPLVNSPGTSITCDTQADIDARIAATGAQAGGAAAPPADNGAANNGGANNGAANNGTANNGGANNGANGGANNAGGGAAAGGDPQTATTLDPAVIATGFANDGQDVVEEGQVRSLTSTNNFINFCLTVPNLKITNGLQIPEGSCNPAPMGAIPAKEKIPTAKFVFPTNNAKINECTPFKVQLKIKNLQTGNFVNAASNYYAAPQQLNADGIIIGHSHVVIEPVPALDSTEPLNPFDFAFFKGLNEGGEVLEADVTKGLPGGIYRVSSINAAANHQPVLAPVAQHGSMDDVTYFEVTPAGATPVAACQ